MNDAWVPAPGRENAIYVFWHSKTFILLPYARGRSVGTLTLLDWKNRVFERLCRLYAYETVPMASERTAMSQLKGLLRRGHAIGLAVDGPRGPAGTLRPGPLRLSQITRKPLIAVRVTFKDSFRLNGRWDRYEIPRPFSEATATLSEPLFVDDLSEAQRRIKGFLGVP